MKRLLINAAILFSLAGTFSSCKKQIADDYQNPEKSSVGSLSKLLSGMYLNTRIHPSYYDYYTFKTATTGAFSQIVAIEPTAQMYVPNPQYVDSRWTDFYAGTVNQNGNDYNYNGPGIMANFTEMKTTYGKLTAQQQIDQLVYMKCAQVIVYDQAAQMIDLWGDIPFMNANSLNLDSRAIQYPAFDDQKSLYDTLISGLKDLNTYFDTVKVAGAVSVELKAQDLLLGGDITKWRRYANSLRLRLLMRISNVDEATAKTEVSTMLGDAATYPLITDNTYNVTLKMNPLNLKSDLATSESNPFAPAYLLDTLMLQNNDPRTPFFFDKYKDSAYIAFPANGTPAQYETTQWSTLDSATFVNNYNVPGVLFTAAEVSFLQAEAAERWGVGDPAAAYANGIQQSVDFYYSIYNTRIASNSQTWPVQPQPTAGDVQTYLGMPAIAYTGTTTEKLAKIYTQKWENFFILQSGEAWAEYRRTGYPALTFATSVGGVAPNPPVRLLYPSSEVLYNPDNYSKVASKDTRDTKIFWDVN